MDQPLLTIGAFASAVGLSTSALRYYDECGLLVPAEVDLATGYRYYTPDLARRARLVVGMRAAGVPIETMRAVLDGPGAEGQKALREFLDAEALRRARAEEALGEVLDEVAYAEEAPARPASPAMLRFEGPALAAALRQVRPAADGDPTSPLSGVLVDAADGSLDVVATNRYWMLVRTPAAQVAGDPARTVLDLAEATELAEVLDAVGEVDAEIADGSLHLSGLAWGSDTAYPAHRLVLAGCPGASTRVVLPIHDLVDAVAATGRAEVDLEITAAGVDVGAAGEPPGVLVPAAVNGEPLGLRIRAALLTRALAACLGETVILELAAADRAVVLRSPYQADLRVLLMPVSPEPRP